jgi:hypothetical protein
MKKSNSIIFTIVLLFSLSFLIFAQSGRRAMSPRAQNMGETVTLKGEITNVLSPLYRYVRLIATFKTNDKEYTVHLGPIRYWNQENLKLEKGKVEIIGEQEEVEGQWHPESSEQALKYATFLAWTTTRVVLCHNKQKRPRYVEG